VTLEEIFEDSEKLLPFVNLLCQRYFVKLLETSRLIGCFHPKYIFNMEPTRVNHCYREMMLALSQTTVLLCLIWKTDEKEKIL